MHGGAGIGIERDFLSREPGREGLDARARTAAAPADRVGLDPFGVRGRQGPGPSEQSVGRRGSDHGVPDGDRGVPDDRPIPGGVSPSA